MTMVVGVFESIVNAQDAVADLVASGYMRSNISVLVRNGLADSPPKHARGAGPRDRRNTPPAVPPICASESDEETERALATTLETAGLQPAAACFFADAICNGAVLVAVHCAAPRARD